MAEQGTGTRRRHPVSILIWCAGAGAAVIISASLNLTETRKLLVTANLWWLAVAATLALAATCGQAIMLRALAKVPLRLPETYTAATAACLAALFAPAGVGAAAANARYLHKKGIGVAEATATAAFTQALLGAIIGLVTLLTALLAGVGIVQLLPDGRAVSIGLTVIVIGVLAAALIWVFPPVRRRVAAATNSLMKQLRKEISWLRSHPLRVTAAVFGALLQIACLCAAYAAALAAFNLRLPVFTLVKAYILANSLGSLVPTPGNIGAIEAALAGGLRIVGVDVAAALGAALAYRLATFWFRAALGWFALRRIERLEPATELR